MADEKRRDEDAQSEEEEEDSLLSRFPDLPPLPELPHAPEVKPKLPPHPSAPKPNAVEPGSYRKMAMASQLASAFIMPIIVLAVGGYFLDKTLHTTPWLAFSGVILGFIVGVMALLRITRQLED